LSCSCRLDKRIPINRFSLNGLYRNRWAGLSRGARDSRHPDPFTGFDPADNVELHKLDRGGDRHNLYPVINVALNVTASRNLGLAGAQASLHPVPLYCGSGSSPGGRTWREGAFRGRSSDHVPA